MCLAGAHFRVKYGYIMLLYSEEKDKNWGRGTAGNGLF